MPETRDELVKELMAARRAVKEAIAAQDSARLKVARGNVNAAKIALGERGPVWWSDDTNFDRHLVHNSPYAEWYEGQQKTHRVRGV